MNPYEYRVNMILQADPNVPRQLLEVYRQQWTKGREETDDRPLHEATVQGIIYHLDASTFRSSRNIEILLWNILVEEYDITGDRRIFDFASAMLQRYRYYQPEYELVRMITHKRV